MGRVVDQHGDHFAYVPSDTAANDWLLVSKAGPTRCPRAMIVRPSSTLLSYQYTIIGQASINHNGIREPIPLARCEHYTPHWHPEDLLLLEWSYLHREQCPQSQVSLANWLELRVCAYEDSSYVQNQLLAKKPSRKKPYHAPPMAFKIATSSLTPRRASRLDVSSSKTRRPKIAMNDSIGYETTSKGLLRVAPFNVDMPLLLADSDSDDAYTTDSD
jgi:hypothetical protein